MLKRFGRAVAAQPDRHFALLLQVREEEDPCRGSGCAASGGEPGAEQLS